MNYAYESTNDDDRFRLICLGFGKSLDRDTITSIFKPVLDAKRSFVLVVHDPSTAKDIPSEYEGIHYHVLTQYEGARFWNDARWTAVSELVKRQDGWFKSVSCYSIKHTCAYFKMRGKEVVINELDEEMRIFWDSVTSQMIMEQEDKKRYKLTHAKSNNDRLKPIMDKIIRYSAWNESVFVQRVYKEEPMETTALFQQSDFSRLFEKAKTLCSQRILDMKFDELCANYSCYQDDGFETVERSVQVMEKWCEDQRIDVYRFARDIQQFIDMQNRKVNCLYLQGQPNSGKSLIAKSIANLCQLYHSVPPGSNRFMFQDTIDKRLILLNEPLLDDTQIEASKEVLEGFGAFVPIKMKADGYLRPTPVIVTTNTPIWSYAPDQKGALMARCYTGYDNLKKMPFLKDVTKDLHPLWIKRVLDIQLEKNLAIAKDDVEQGRGEFTQEEVDGALVSCHTKVVVEKGDEKAAFDSKLSAQLLTELANEDDPLEGDKAAAVEAPESKAP